MAENYYIKYRKINTKDWHIVLKDDFSFEKEIFQSLNQAMDYVAREFLFIPTSGSFGWGWEFEIKPEEEIQESIWKLNLLN